MKCYQGDGTDMKKYVTDDVVFCLFQKTINKFWVFICTIPISAILLYLCE